MQEDELMATADKTPVIDADAHVVESAHTWDYMDSSEKQYRPIPLETREESGVKLQFWVIDGKVRGFRFPAFSAEELEKRSQQVGRKFADAQESRELGNVDLRVQHMDDTGVDVQVLHNTMFIESATDRAAVELALCHSWNRWLADIWRQGKGRLRWSMLPPLLNITEALEEMRIAKANGAVAVCMRPVEGNRLLVDPYFYPIYQEAESLYMPIAVHIANGNPALLDLTRSPYQTGGGFGAFRIPTVMACQQVLTSDLPQQFPHLRWGFIEASAQWVPWVVEDAKERYAVQGRPIPKNPMEECRVWVTCQTNDDLPFV